MSAAQSQPWRLSQPPSQRKLGLSEAPKRISFPEKYRPTCLAEVLGQSEVVGALAEFSRSPYPRAFLLAGPTGCGKTSAAMALAADLGVDEASRIHSDQSWTFHWIRSGTMDLAETERILNDMRFAPMGGGWRLILVDEADLITARAKQLWLSALESIPAQTVIVFTTNRLDKFEQRELDRFQVYTFAATGDESLAAAQSLADAIWCAETGGEDGPDVARLPNAILAGQVSYRRVATAMESLIQYGAPLCSAPDASGAPLIPPIATPPPAAVAIAAPHVAKPKPERKPAGPVSTSPEAWWNALTAGARVEALRRVPLASIPFAKVQDRTRELIARGNPPEYGRYLNMQPVIVAAWGASQ